MSKKKSINTFFLHFIVSCIDFRIYFTLNFKRKAMISKNTIANLTFGASIVLLLISAYTLYLVKANLHISNQPMLMATMNVSDVCNNQYRIIPSQMTKDNSTTYADQRAAKNDFLAYKNVHTSEPWGAWLGKDLVDSIFVGNSYNGIYIWLGKENTTGKLCFIVKGQRSDRNKRTIPLNYKYDSYYRLDAMCPTYCDGLDPTTP